LGRRENELETQTAGRPPEVVALSCQKKRSAVKF